jgi:quinol monooxygenase YgiN
MNISRREFVAIMSSTSILAAVSGCATLKGQSEMYGLIGKMRIVPGQRDALISILIEGVAGMPGCLSYVVAQDATDPDAIWITEVWDSQKSHQASLTRRASRSSLDLARDSRRSQLVVTALVLATERQGARRTLNSRMTGCL